MSWISDIIKGGAEGLIGSVADAADRLFLPSVPVPEPPPAGDWL